MRRHGRIESALPELVREQPLHLGRHIANERGERPASLRHGRVAHQDAEPVGRALDVIEQLQRRLLHELARVPNGGERVGQSAEQRAHLAVNDHRVNALLAAKVFVDDGLGNIGSRGDLLDGNRLESLLGEERARNVEKLLAALASGHAGARHAARFSRHGPSVP